MEKSSRLGMSTLLNRILLTLKDSKLIMMVLKSIMVII